jgi:phosphatidylglycerophosphatase A
MADPLGEPVSARHLALRTPSGFVAFGMGAGLSPVAPGTAGSLFALPLAVPLLWLPPLLFWLAWLAAFFAAAWCCGTVSRRLGAADPGGIVCDEILAMWLVLACIPADWRWWLAAFALFRLFDIVKPWPIRALERRVEGGFGIMLDDILAAAYALALLLPASALLGG